MARRSKGLLDYEKLAATKGLIFRGGIAPRHVTESTQWECVHCHRVMRKPYTSVKQSKNSCQCRWHTLQPHDYEKLAEQLGVKWIGSYPKNVRTLTLWENVGGQNFEAAYNELAYKIPNRLREYLNDNHS